MDQSTSSETTSQDSSTNPDKKRIDELITANTILKANISTLYRTAKAEIARKDDRIAQLQSELDNYIFRRADASINQTKKDAKVVNE